MRVRSTRWSALIVGLAWLGSATFAAQKPPALPDLLKLATDYVAQYAQQLSAVAAKEEFTQYETSTGQMGTPKRLTSAIVLFGQSDGSILTFRDVMAIDTVAVRPQDDRLAALFTPVSDASLTGAQQFTDAAVRSYYSTNFHVLDSPVMAFDLLRPQNQSNYTFKIDGTKKINGVETAVIKFREKGKGHVIPDAAAVGTFWVDVTNGAIQQTELGLIADSVNAHTTVKFTKDAQLGLLVPSDLFEQVETSSRGTGMSDMGGGGGMGGHEGLEGRAVYSKYRRVSASR
jgi:hypothetical protein